MTISGEPGFWAFSLEVYSRPGVAAACIDLQDTAEADVNMILFSLWAAHRGRLLIGADMAALEAAIAPWRADIVRPLRAVRRKLKGVSGAENLREIVKQAELEAGGSSRPGWICCFRRAHRTCSLIWPKPTWPPMPSSSG